MLESTWLRFAVQKRAYSVRYKQWRSMNIKQKQGFINGLVATYAEQYPGSKSNVSFKSLKQDMEFYGDAPAVFGVIYDSIWELQKVKQKLIHSNDDGHKWVTDNIIEHGRFAHHRFQELLVEEDKNES
ncbi:HGR052Cp [Eremothecium sinecaudum]|uniref:HGR052Cp n=1 Tax=Eremothecium sinecaudum TaxID=45286 RepID=A0A0X8HVB1_9SACH|nr:HGR052Cp [Eremothecium sinecaudum]AMD22391.1 HGR052Cp [Eremothecium sinecaudum]